MPVNPLSSLPSLSSAFDKITDGIAGGIEALKSLLSFSQNARLLSLDLSSAGTSVGTSLVVERANGSEGLDQLDPFIVDALSSSAYLELKTLVGTEAGLSVVCADGGTRSWYGLVSRIAAMGADGGLARYRLWLSPWPVLLGLREDSFIFQDQTTLDTVDALLADYPLARYEIRVADATRSALPKHAIRTQYRETDLVFLQRILAADGLSFWIEHDQDATTNAGGALRHTLVITDEAHDWAAATQASIRYHRLSATETEDAIHGFIATRQVRTNAVTRSGWNAQSVFAPSGDDQVAPPNDAIPQLEDHDGGGDAGRADLGTDVAARIAHLRLLAHQVDAARFHGDSSVRTLAPGRVFTLTDHPDFGDDLASAATSNTGFGSGLADARFKICSVSHRMSNNLRTGLDDAAARGDGLGERGTYTNTFECVPAAVAIVPQPPVAPAAPGLLTALVVGVEGEGATTHRDHEVRIQFHFQRGVAPNPGGLSDTGWDGATNPDTGNAPGSEASGTWVRVSQALAGPDYGMVFVPRVGTEVLVAFEQGDLDRPIIVGSLHNGNDLPPFQAGVDSGVDHPGVIAGFHSKTLASPDANGSGYNQLILDDTAGQLGAQLASSTQASQVNLGTHVQRSPGTATRGASRGEGAELATDGWAVFRAGQGGLVSATARSEAAGSQLDAQEALGQMKGAAALAQALSDAAEAQSAPKLTTPKDLEDFGTLIGTTVPAQAAKDPSLSIPAFSAPALFQETPASAALTSPASIVSFASQALHVVAQDQVHLASGKTVELASGTDTALFTHQGGLTAIAANGSVSIQAHTDELKVLADQSVTVTSTAGKIEILADKKIVLQAGQGSITLDGGNITFAMPGLFSVKGSQQTLTAAGSNQAAMPELPTGSLPKTTLVIERLYHDNEPLAGAPYRATLADGSTRSGTLDGGGRATLTDVPIGTAVEVSFGAMPGQWERKDLTPTPDHKPKPTQSDIDALIDKYAPAQTSGSTVS